MKQFEFVVVTLLFALATVVAAQEGRTASGVQPDLLSPRTPQAGKIFVPESSKEQPALHAHTNYVLHNVDGVNPTVMSKPTPLGTAGPLVLIQEPETPNSMGCLYVKNPSSPGCKPFAVAGGPSSAGYGAIAIVDVFDNPQAAKRRGGFQRAMAPGRNELHENLRQRQRFLRYTSVQRGLGA